MEKNQNIEKTLAFGVAVLIGLGCLVVIRPFISGLLWAVIICYTTWPGYQYIKKWTKGRESLSALIMTFLVACVVLMPFLVIAGTVAEHISKTAEIKLMIEREVIPNVSIWLGKIPMAGSYLQNKWQSLRFDSVSGISYLKSFIAVAHPWFFRRFFDLGEGVFQLSLSVFACFFFYRDGEIFGKLTKEIAARVAGTFSHHLIETVGNTVRAVVYGFIGTAIWQGVVAGFGLWLAGVPWAFFLGLLTFLLSPVPVGPPLIWGGASVWLFHQGSIGWGIFLLIWGMIAVSSADNLIKTYLISKSANISFFLIFLGVIGGVVYFGFIGVFLGPVLLSVGWRMIKEYSIHETSS